MNIRDRVKEFRRVPASELRPNPKNWRTHPKEQQDALRGLLAEVGFAGAELCRELPDGSLMLIDGHCRAEIMGTNEVPCLILDVTEAEADKLLATFDPIGAMAGADRDKLDSLLREVQTESQDVAKMLEELGKQAGCAWAKEQQPIIEDEVPEPPVVPITQPGDLWVMGDHRLLCGDSTKADDVGRLMAGAKAEMMFTDPPYGVDYSGGVQFDGKGGSVTNNRERLANDSNADIYAKFLPVCLPFVDGPCYLWFAGSKALPVYQAVHDCGGIVSALLIWHKTNATYAAMNAQYKQRHEPLLYFKPKGSTLRWVGPTDACTLWEFKRDGQNEFHPTQKPVALSANAMKNHTADTVADFFAGSGSTIIAAEQLSRRCYAMEISPLYCDVACARWSNLTGRKPVRERDGVEFNA